MITRYPPRGKLQEIGIPLWILGLVIYGIVRDHYVLAYIGGATLFGLVAAYFFERDDKRRKELNRKMPFKLSIENKGDDINGRRGKSRTSARNRSG